LDVCKICHQRVCHEIGQKNRERGEREGEGDRGRGGEERGR
jgi:hypothetical protein